MKSPRFALVAALCLAFTAGIAGCVKESGGTEPLDTGTPTATGAPPAASVTASGSTSPTVASKPADTFDWTSCIGLSLGIDMLTPLYDAERPDGWNASQDDSAVDGVLGYTLLKCDRVSWGPFERGPVYIMMEDHNDFEIPSKCAEGDFTHSAIVRLAWFSDPDLAKYARDEFGMPADVADVSYDLSKTGSVQVVHWTWSLPGGDVSETFFESDDNYPINIYDPDWRFFWDNGAGVSFVDLVEHYKTPEPHPGQAYGTLAPPMLYGESMPDDRFVTAGMTDLMLEAHFHGDITRFSDSQCKTPV